MAYNHPPHEESVDALYSRLESKIYKLTAMVPVPYMKTVTREKYYRDVAVDKATALIPEVQTLMNQYGYREKDDAKAALAWRFGERFIEEAYKWFDELEEVYNEVRLKEIIILDNVRDNVRNNVELFSENDDRCIYKFIKQVDPLKASLRNY